MRWQLQIVLIFISCSVLAQTTNPFSISRSTPEPVKEITPQEENTSDIDTKLQGENPFNISHIPIRKNQYEEIERLAVSSTRVAEQDISLSYLPLWIIVTSLCMLAYLLYHKKDHLLVLIRSLANENFMRLTSYEENGGKSIPYVLGYAIFLLNAALFLYLYITKQYSYTNDYFYLKLLGGIVIFFIGKHVVNMIGSWIYHLQKQSQLYDFTIISVYNLLSVVLLCINIVILFGRPGWIKTLAIIGVFFFVIALLSRYYKGLRIGQNLLNGYFFHFFLYFCAFEFAPWVLIYSTVRDLI